MKSPYHHINTDVATGEHTPLVECRHTKMGRGEGLSVHAPKVHFYSSTWIILVRAWQSMSSQYQNSIHPHFIVY